MSENKSNLGTAGMVVAGGALLGAACYAAYEMFKNSGFLQSEQPTVSDHNNSSQSRIERSGIFRSEEPTSDHYNSSQRRSERRQINHSCPVCQKNCIEDSFFLPCGHQFHNICLQANRILHLDEDEYKCPVCKIPVPHHLLNDYD